MKILENIKSNKIILYTTLIVLGIVSILPMFFMEGIPHYYPEDTLFHLSRVKGFENVWSSPVNYNSFDGMGSYVNVFYPWLTLYPMHLLLFLFSDYVIAYKVYLALLGIVTIFIAFYSGKLVSGKNVSAFCFAVLYCFSSYRFICVFRRAALGESIAMAILPLVFAALYLILFSDYRKWFLLSLGFAFLTYTHLLSLYMSAGFVLVFFLICIPYLHDRRVRLYAFIKACFSSVIMSLGVIIPVLTAGIENLIYSPEGDIDDLVSNSTSFPTFIKNSVLNDASARSIGLILLIVIIIDAIAIIIKVDIRKRVYSTVCFTAGIVLLLIECSALFWRSIGSISFLRIIQYPWRLNAYISLFFLISFSVILARIDLKNKSMIVLVTLLVLSSAFIEFFSAYKLYPEREINLNDEIINGISVSYLDYSPYRAAVYRSVDWSILDNAYMDGEVIDVTRSVSEDGTILTFGIDDGMQGSIVELPVYWFSSIVAFDNGVQVDSYLSDRGTVRLELNSLGSNTIELFHKYSYAVYISWIISALTFVYLFYQYILKKS